MSIEEGNIIEEQQEEEEQPAVNILNRSSSGSTKSTPPPTSPAKMAKQDMEISHMSQLTSIEKQKVKVLFREAVVKGFRMDQIPDFIFIKSRLNVTHSLVVTLKKMQKADDRYWFYELARDSLAYLSCYRLAIDKLSQLETEMWLIIINPKIEPAVRILATKEVHSITKTSVLLLRDLPFITNLSKFYDLSDLDPEKKGIKKLQQEKDPKDNNNYDPLKREFNRSDFDNLNSSLVHTILENVKDTRRIDAVTSDPKTGKKLVDADVMEEMQQQMKTLGYDTDPASMAARDKKREEIEDRYIGKSLTKLDGELSGVETDDEKKVAKIIQDYRKTLNYLDEIVSPEHRKAISRIRSITDSEEEDENDDE
jgi:hypothetical protein